MKKIAVLLADGCEEVEAVTPIDFLRRADIEVITAGVTGPKVTGSHGIEIAADKEIGEVVKMVDQLDGIVLPGGMPGATNIAASGDAVELVKKCAEAGKLVAAICASPAVVLSPNGIVTGRQVTCYPGFEEKLTDSKFRKKRVIVDGNVITSRGPGTAAEFAVEIIKYLEGSAAAFDVHKATLQK